MGAGMKLDGTWEEEVEAMRFICGLKPGQTWDDIELDDDEEDDDEDEDAN